MDTARLVRIVGAVLLAASVLIASPASAKSPGLDNQGKLDAFDKNGRSLGPCPLKHTEVKAEIAGFITRVTVRQQFHNPFPNKIEAVYVFPLSENAAVDRMTMMIGDRVIDKSGSMSGFPIETAKKAMRRCIEGLHENDTFNLMTFEGGVGFCFSKPVPNTGENRRKAIDYLQNLRGSGGTEMMKAIHACLAGQDDPERVRVVCFMTDGYVGNDMAIIDAVKKNAGQARVFSFGIGRSVNRFLLDGMARAGRGEVHYILNQEQAEGAGERFYERIRMPVLTDVQLDFGSLAVENYYPKQVADLFSSKPIVVKGRYKQSGNGTITLRGKTGEGAFERKIAVELPDRRRENDVLAPLWARAKVDHLMDQDLAGVQRGKPDPAIQEEMRKPAAPSPTSGW